MTTEQPRVEALYEISLAIRQREALAYEQGTLHRDHQNS